MSLWDLVYQQRPIHNEEFIHPARLRQGYPKSVYDDGGTTALVEFKFA